MTSVTSLLLDDIVAPMVIDAPINGRSFRPRVEKTLVKTAIQSVCRELVQAEGTPALVVSQSCFSDRIVRGRCQSAPDTFAVDQDFSPTGRMVLPCAPLMMIAAPR